MTSNRNKINDIYGEIILSKKYAGLYAPLIMRICAEEYAKYKKDKDRIKAVKNKLHIIHGAFSGDYKKAAEIIKSGDIKNISAEIMRLHASTNERLETIGEFYDFIFGITGQVESVLDIGCGFNPFSLPFINNINKSEIKKYYAYDIDRRAADLLNNYFKLLNLPELAKSIDIIAETPEDIADAAFIFKLIPVIEQQSAGRAFKLLQKINAAYIVATYPVKSLCGKNKGMAVNYAKSFESNIAGKFKIIGQKIIGGELVYIIKKQV